LKIPQRGEKTHLLELRDALIVFGDLLLDFGDLLLVTLFVRFRQTLHRLSSRRRSRSRSGRGNRLRAHLIRATGQTVLLTTIVQNRQINTAYALEGEVTAREKERQKAEGPPLFDSRHWEDASDGKSAMAGLRTTSFNP
jgi:hypothetical protein